MPLLALSLHASAEDFTTAVRACLQRRVEVEKRDVGIVIGLVDEHGSRIVSYGKMDNGTDQEVDGDTLFDIASITKAFTGLLLQDMIDRGEMKLDDPVQKYLPASVRMPARNGREITLRHLVTHTSGLPHFADNLNPTRADQPFADYTVEELNAFLSGYRLTRDPGTKFEYSSLGAGVLGHVIALKAGSDYESLVVDRICRPLKMDSTRITLTPELKARFATGHNRFGEAVPSWDRQTQLGGSALRSTANDLLKFVSANLGLTPSRLTPAMEKTHRVHLANAIPETDIGLAWMITSLQGTRVVHHGGMAPGYCTFAGFDKARRRGVVLLSSSYNGSDLDALGMLLLKSEWQSQRRPRAARVSGQLYDTCVGQYRLSPNSALGMLATRLLLRSSPRGVAYVPALVPAAVSHLLCALANPTIGIRREGDRLFFQYDIRLSPVAAIFVPRHALAGLPRITGELLPESESRFFERLTGMPVTLSRDDRGMVTRVTAHFLGATFSHERISDQPPEAYEPPKPRITVKLDRKLLDACVGQYGFAPTATFPTGIKATIRRQGDQLIWQARGRNVIPGPFNAYPESETGFFIKVHGPQLTFIKNDRGEVTALSLHDDAWLPDGVGRKLKKE